MRDISRNMQCFFSALYGRKQERALMAVRGPVRTGRASGLDRKDFSGGREPAVFYVEAGIPRQKKTGSIFFRQKCLIHSTISVTIKEQMFLVRHLSGYGVQ